MQAGKVKIVAPTMGSLFDGIGGFPLAALRLGVKPMWASEIEATPISISKRHFPNMRHLGDITEISGADIEPVNIITFGSPCQDLSVAGNRAGLNGKRSSLFLEAVRIINEMRKKYGATYPRVIVWENVPGAFSSNRGEDFRIVLEQIARIAEPRTSIPKPTRRGSMWKPAGGILGNGWSLAWRILDAQYWGVPQRRRRIFLVADFGSESAGEILFKQESKRRDFETGKTAWEENTGHIAAGFNGWRSVTGTLECEVSRAPCVQFTMPPNIVHPQVTGTICSSGAGLNRPAGMASETDLCIAIDCRNHNTQSISGTLQAKSGGGHSLNFINPVVIPYSFKSFGEYEQSDRGKTLMACDDNTTCDLVAQEYVVRRLTPTECERLQGFPDGWTEYGHDDKPISDTQRYKALGNSVAIPCVEYIFQGVSLLFKESEKGK